MDAADARLHLPRVSDGVGLLHPQLDQILQQVSAARARFARLSASTPDERWAVRADPSRWSVAECIAHLNLTARAMEPLLERAADEARRLGGPSPARFRRNLVGIALGAMVGPVPGWGRIRVGRVKTPPPFIPTALDPRATITAEFERHLAAQEAIMRSADGSPLDRAFVESPFVTGVRYDAFSGCLIQVRHIHRHLAQAERVWGIA